RRGRFETAERALREGSAPVAEAMAGRLFAPGAPAALRDRWRAIMAGTPPAGVAAAARAMAGRTDSRQLLRHARLPVLVLAGADDAVIPLDEAREMAEQAPGGQIRVISGAGHMSPVERPDEFSAALADF